MPNKNRQIRISLSFAGPWRLIFIFSLAAIFVTAAAAGQSSTHSSNRIHSLENRCQSARSDGDLEELLSCTSELVGEYCANGLLESAERLSNDFLATARSNEDKRLEAWGLDFVGNVLFYRAAYPEALDAFSRSALLMRESSDIGGEATALKDIGITQKYLYKPFEAIDTLNSALPLFKQAGDLPGLMSTLLNLAMIYQRLGFKKQGLATREQVLQLARANNDQMGVLHALAGIGDIYSESGSPEQAMEMLLEALKISEDIKAPRDYRIGILVSIVWANYRLGNFEEAIRVQEEILALSKQSEIVDPVATAYRDLGDLYIEVDPEKALENFRLSLDMRKKQKAPILRFVHAGMAEAYLKLGDLEASIEFFEKAVQEYESAQSGIASNRQRSALLGESRYIYTGLVEAYVQRAQTNANSLNDNERAFDAYEKAKSRRLSDSISTMQIDAPPELTYDLDSEYKSLSNKVSELQRSIARSDLIDSDRKILLDELNRLEIDLEILVAKTEMRDTGSSLKNRPQPNVLGRVQNILDDETALVEYSVGVKSTTVFVIGKTSLTVETLPITADDLNAWVQNHIDLLAYGSDAGWQDLSIRLEKDLIDTVRKHLASPINKIIIVPDGSLHYLPFETLMTADRRLLIEDFEISYAPSATVFAQLSERKRPDAEKGALIFANPDLSSNTLVSRDASSRGEMMRSLFEIADWSIDPIPESENEANTIEQMVGAGSKVFLAAVASERQLKSENISQYQILHFATHGLVSEDIPERSSLLLAAGGDGVEEDGLLQAREIYHLQKTPDLVVLSACKTANGQILKGEGLESLAQAFLYAGSRSVVGSLWNVNDKRSADLMRQFYKNMSAGKSKAAALRGAKLAILRSEPQTPPRYWAPFILIGEPGGTLNLQPATAQLSFWERIMSAALKFKI